MQNATDLMVSLLRSACRSSSSICAADPNGEIDENFWAQAAADQAQGDLDGMDGLGE